MKNSKLSRIAVLVASVTLAAGAQASDNWNNGSGDLVWKNGTSELCWRNAYWTPATAHPDCDGAIQPAPAPVPVAQAPAPAPVATPAPAPAPAPAPMKSMSFQAETLFDFDKSVVKPAGKAALDGMVDELAKVDVETLIAVGHTDSVGAEQYNQKLSLRRVEAVKAYLVSKGVPADQIRTEGKGESEPVASNRTREGRAQNRRVEIQVIGTQKPM